MKSYRWLALGVSLSLLASCGDRKANEGGDSSAGGGISANRSATAGSDPSQQDAENAMQQLASWIPIGVNLPSVGTPRECQSGTKDGSPVRVCKFCARLLLVTFRDRAFPVVRGLSVTTANISLPFKRALSYDQPDIVPADGASGVWLAAINSRQPSQPLPFSSSDEEEVQVPSQEITKLGVFIEQTTFGDGSYAVQSSQGGMNLSREQIMQVFSSPQSRELFSAYGKQCQA